MPGYTQPTAPPMARRTYEPGLLDQLNRWFDAGAANLQQHWRGAKNQIDNLNDKAAAERAEIGSKAFEAGKSAAEATRSAVDAVAKLPTARMMTGRERCPVAPNGAPDCQSAADALCRKHGYSSGKSMDFTSARECPTRVWLSGRADEGACSTVTFISRAMCQ